ncbi:DUF4365 domain-containing protein [Sorangium sp. So ce117]|uniref:DUF4365 domain-containing protein n=1 Tax=Sorangium sp. So ce117 TaxID=3133277 RepID=UPI003F5EE2E7
MPGFQESNAIGLAGEYLVGAVVARALRWPYRMQPIADMGVDGEIEVIDPQGRSTGRLIKVQAKSTERVGERTRYVKREHFEYWRDLAVPVVVAHPIVEEMRVLWFELKHGRYTEQAVAFDLDSANELSAQSAHRLSELAVERHHLFDPSLGLIRKVLEDTILHDAIYDEAGQLDYTPHEDLDTVENLQKYGKVMERWAELEKLDSLGSWLSPRAKSQLTRLRGLVDHTTRRLEQRLGIR